MLTDGRPGRITWRDKLIRAKPFTEKQVSSRHPYLLTDSLFYKLGDLFPGTQWDSHLFQVLNCAQELKSETKKTPKSDILKLLPLFLEKQDVKKTSGACGQDSSLHAFMDAGCNSYKRFDVNLLVIKCGLVL